jgi:23S rRNA (adenine-N6)-dimethyltransferase
MRRTDPRITHRRPELSQHFLRDAATARATVRRMALPACALVVEAGAGDGLLTEALADADFRVIAIEKDERLSGLLRQRLASRPNVACRRADFLTFP